MRVSILFSALAASAIASPAVMKRAVNTGNILAPSVNQFNGVLASAFGSLSNINSALGTLSSMASVVNVPGDLVGDTSLLMQNSQIELSTLVDDVNNAVAAMDLGSQVGVVSSSVDIVSGQIQQLLGDLTGVGNFYPDTAAIARVQDAAGNLLASLQKVSSAAGQ